MIGLTIVIAILAVAVAFWLSPPTALGLLVCSMLLYPEYLRVPIGPIKMSVPRFMAMALVIRLASSAASRGFRWRLIDRLVCVEWVWAVTAGIIAGTDQTMLSEKVGVVFDTVLMYFAARFCMLKLSDCGALFKPLVVCAIVAGGLGVVESVTKYSPYEFLQQYSAVRGFSFGGESFGDIGELRYGFLRARGATGMSLYFGVAMFLLAGMLYSLRGFTRQRWLWACGVIAALLGSVSSMSAGPQSALVTFTILVPFYFFPKLIKPALAALIVLIILGELAARRHFWYWIEYLNPLGGDSYYRSALIDVAILQWRDYWLVGVGNNVPGHWGMLIDGRQFVDIVNEFIIVAVTSGFLGVACRVTILVLALRDSVRTYRAGGPELRSLGFGQGATLVGLSVAGMSTGFFGPARLLTYMLLGMMVRTPMGEMRRANGVRSRARTRQVPPAARGLPQPAQPREPKPELPLPQFD